MDYPITEYNPSVSIDDTVEWIDVDSIGGYTDVIKSFVDADTVEMTSDIDKLTFYGVELKHSENNSSVYFFRRVTKFKRLKTNGMLAFFQGNKLVKFDNAMLGMDGLVDIVVINQKAYVFNHISLERIFKMQEQYNSLANQALGIITKHNRISNFEQFENDCLDDKRVQKTLSKMLSEKDMLDRAFQNFDAIEKTIDMFQLDISIGLNKDNKKVIQYDPGNKELLINILLIMRDSYYTSTIGQRPGIDMHR